MTLTPKNFVSVQVPSTKGDLLAPASGHIYQVHNILIHNTNTITENVIIYYHDGTNERQIFDEDILAGETFMPEWIGEGFILDGDNSAKFTGETDTASKVNFIPSGSDRTP
jgi:hypothetical protein